MGKNKLQKFNDLSSYPNVYQCFDIQVPELVGEGMQKVDIQGKWNKEHFTKDQPITLELACGGGEYTVAMAKMHPHRNFVGVDIKGARIWKGATQALEDSVSNAGFLRTRIEIAHLFFAPNEVSEIWITFPDPFPRNSKSNRRLTSPYFLNIYKKFLKENAIIHLKTDADSLYDFTLETIAADEHLTLLYNDDDIYSKPLPLPELSIKTYYEAMHLEAGKTIKYIKFSI